MDIIDKYKNLAQRNGWNFSMDVEANRPYFMKDGKYAIPDEHTTKEDKEMLADIIAEGSDELKRIILMCWDNGVVITGPCSGIREFHEQNPFALHLGIIADGEIIEPLYTKLQELLPDLSYMCRDNKGKIRFDMTLALEDRELSKEQSELIFGTVANELESLLNINKDDKKALT